MPASTSSFVLLLACSHLRCTTALPALVNRLKMRTPRSAALPANLATLTATTRFNTFRDATPAAVQHRRSEVSPARQLEGNAIPFVTIDDANQTLSLHPPALDALASLPAPLCMLTMVGTARDGKSSWLNMYTRWLQSVWPTSTPIDPSGDFNVDHDFFGTGTVGGWMRAFTGEGGRPLPGTECVSLVLVDTQGLKGQVQALFDMVLLAMMSSSTVMLNVMYQLNEDALERLRGLTSHAVSKLPYDLLGGDAPKLWVLLRDARLRLEQHGRSLLPDAALHAALQPTGDKLDAVRSSLLGLFPNRSMALLKQPDADDLARMAEVGAPPESRPFWASVAASAQRTTASLRPKIVGGVPLSGELLAASLHRLVDGLNSRRDLSMRRAVQSLLQQQAQLAVASAQEVFRELAPPLELASGRMAAVTLPMASLEFRLRNATQAAYSEFLAGIPSLDAAATALLQPYAEQLHISLEAAADQQRQAHDFAVRTAALRASERQLRAMADERGDQLRWLRAQHRAFTRSGWQDVAGGVAGIALATGSVLLPGGWAAKLWPALWMAPAAVAGMGLWRAAGQRVLRLASRVLGVVPPASNLSPSS